MPACPPAACASMQPSWPRGRLEASTPTPRRDTKCLTCCGGPMAERPGTLLRLAHQDIPNDPAA